jgi:hypothetical protein
MLFQSLRLYNVRVATREALAHRFAGIRQGATDLLCQGYRVDDLLWLNDSLTQEPDRYQEYAVLRLRARTFIMSRGVLIQKCLVVQIDSVTINGSGDIVRILDDTSLSKKAWPGSPLYVYLDTRTEHECELCK